jgi:hypothetical protein
MKKNILDIYIIIIGVTRAIYIYIYIYFGFF